MNIPLNGRIAIIDDKFDQALPLINALAQRRCPYLYYSGEVKYLPAEGDQPNDIRILFLDINLIDEKVHPDKELKSRLVPVLSRVISKDNYPYILIYWSRNEDEHSSLVTEIFEKDLPDRKPIAFLSQDKLSYFKLDGNKTENFEENITTLFKKISDQLSKHQAYRYLIDWENSVHISADKTLQEIFSPSSESWSDNAGFLIAKMGESYAGRKAYKEMSVEDKIKSSFQAFNNVFYDTLEYSITNTTFKDEVDLEYKPELAQKENVYSVNKKLLISGENDIMEYSGTVIHDSNSATDKIFEELLNNAFNRKMVVDYISHKPENAGKNGKELTKLIDDASSSKRKEIRESWKKIYTVVTPLCDYVQRKYFNTRCVKGIIIKAEYVEFIDDRSEAIFISPKFKFDKEVYVIVLHYRYFFTAPATQGFKLLSPLFRIRQQLLAEIQSKLSRHISRQGVLFIDEF